MITQLTLMLSTVNVNERSGPPVTHCFVLTISITAQNLLLLAENPCMKARAWQAKPLILPSLHFQPAITFCLGQLKVWWEPPPPPPTLGHTRIHTRAYKRTQIHIWSVFVPILQSRKCRHSEDAPGTLFSKQASPRRRCSVIIHTMTVWVYTWCHSGRCLPSGGTASLFLRLALSFTLQMTMLL